MSVEYKLNVNIPPFTRVSTKKQETFVRQVRIFLASISPHNVSDIGFYIIFDLLPKCL